jgi:hypothetical protein
MTNGGFSHEALADVTAKLVRNLNLIIDRTTTPPSARVSNLKHRPIGIGSTGWRTCSPRGVRFRLGGVEMERGIFRVIYHAAMMESAAGGRVQA